MKRILIDLARRTETVKQGTFPIQVLEPIGNAWLMEREYVGHPHIRSARSYLIPDRHIWVMFFTATQGRHPYEVYIHACEVHQEDSRLRVDDLYADVIRYWNGRWTVADLEEMAAAVAAGELTRAQVAAALRGVDAAIGLLERAGVGQVEACLRQMLGG